MMEFTAGRIVHKDELNNMARQQKFGVISGCETTADSPASLDVIVSAGDYLINGVKYSTLGDTITITPDATYNSSASIFLDTSGAVSVEYGALSLNDDTTGKPLPTYDYDADTHLPIARIFVGGGASAISQSNIKSLRIENKAFLPSINDNYSITSDYYAITVSVSDSNQFTTSSNPGVWHLKNNGLNNIYINFDAIATINNAFLKPGEILELVLNKASLNYICDPGLTSELSIIYGYNNLSYSSVISKKVIVTNSNTEIYDDINNFKEWLIYNDGLDDAFINFSNVATTSNYKLKVGEFIKINVETNIVFAISETSSTTLRLIATGD